MKQSGDNISEPIVQLDSSDLDVIINILLDHLETERTRIAEEIRAYPSPIPACDAQFNHLLEKRTKLSQELNKLHGLKKDPGKEESGKVQLREFVASSDSIHPDTKRQMMAFGRRYFDSISES